MNVKLSRTLVRSVLAGALVLFFLPFLTLSCGQAKLVTLSGVQLATGSSLKVPDRASGGEKVQEIKAQPLASAAAVLAVLGLVLAFLPGVAGKFGPVVTSALVMAACLALKGKVEADLVRENGRMITAQWEFGFWLLILAEAGGIVLACLPGKPDRQAPLLP